jgi:hypothetical protein
VMGITGNGQRQPDLAGHGRAKEVPGPEAKARMNCNPGSGRFGRMGGCFAGRAALWCLDAGERILDAIGAADAVVLLPSLGRLGDSRLQKMVLGGPLPFHVGFRTRLTGVDLAFFAGFGPADRARKL